MGKPSGCYAIYRGDKFLDLGSLEELGKKFNVKPNTIYFYSTPTYRKRTKPDGNNFIVIRIGDMNEQL